MDAVTSLGSRIVVTGMAGAGKSTFSKRLAARTGLPLIHLDLYSWNPGWIRVPAADFIEKQQILLASEEWIVDSNDVDEEILLARADTLVVLATPWWLCASRAFRRGLRRPKGSQLPTGCSESFSQRITDEWGIVWRNWRNRTAIHERDRALASRCRDHMFVHILSSREQQDRVAAGINQEK